MLSALVGLLVVGTLVLLPLLLLGAFFRVVLAVVLLPFKLLGAALSVAFAGAGLLLKLVFGAGGPDRRPRRRAASPAAAAGPDRLGRRQGGDAHPGVVGTSPTR